MLEVRVPTPLDLARLLVSRRGSLGFPILAGHSDGPVTLHSLSRVLGSALLGAPVASRSKGGPQTVDLQTCDHVDRSNWCLQRLESIAILRTPLADLWF